jgi:hypothetical protein
VLSSSSAQDKDAALLGGYDPKQLKELAKKHPDSEWRWCWPNDLVLHTRAGHDDDDDGGGG